MRHALALLVFLTPMPALAQAIPAHDVDAACGRLSPREAVASCVRQEQYAYNVLGSLWPLLTPQGRGKVLADGRALQGTASYYVGLVSYAQGRLAIEQQQRDAVVTPRFRP